MMTAGCIEYVETFTKDPDGKLPYTIDWSAWLTPGDTLQASAWVAEGLLLSSPTFDDTSATVWVAGGNAGTRYTVTNRVTTQLGVIDDRSIEIACAQR